MKQQRATHRPHLPQAKTSERESTAAAIVCAALAGELNSSRELTQTGVSLFLTTAVAAELDAAFDRLY